MYDSGHGVPFDTYTNQHCHMVQEACKINTITFKCIKYFILIAIHNDMIR